MHLTSSLLLDFLFLAVISRGHWRQFAHCVFIFYFVTSLLKYKNDTNINLDEHI